MSHPSPTAAADLTTVFAQFASGFDTLKDRHSYLQQHPELLTAPAIDAANAYILDWRDNGYIKSSLIHLRVFRNLLKRAMVVGVDAACLESEPSREVIAAIQALFRAEPGYDLFKTLAANRKHLTSPQAVGAFDYMRAKFEDDQDRLQRVEATWDAIVMFREDATEATADSSPPDSPLRELDSRDKVHLNWLFENQPALVRRLYQTGKLYEHLDKKMQRALERVDNLKQKLGLSEDEAFEIATSEILAPPDGPAMSDNPPEPVPWPEQRTIWHNL